MNARHLAGVQLPSEWQYQPDILAAISKADILVAAVPSRNFRSVLSQLSVFSGPVISATKGIEFDTGLTMCGVIERVMPKAIPSVISGPSFAEEVARGMPTATVTASANPETATLVQKLFHTSRFRVYTSTDRIGVELGGALKNVIAIAAGVCDGLGFGDSSKAALITRAMAEVRRLGTACGANPETFAGLSGLGDLTVTCFSRHSRKLFVVLESKLSDCIIQGESTKSRIGCRNKNSF
jgi:glycerol-3-phosphate dehydrogenase (NAD(P)+)